MQFFEIQLVIIVFLIVLGVIFYCFNKAESRIHQRITDFSVQVNYFANSHGQNQSEQNHRIERLQHEMHRLDLHITDLQAFLQKTTDFTIRSA